MNQAVVKDKDSDVPLVTREDRTAEPARFKFHSTNPLLFTTSKWNAISHISGNSVAVEASYPNPYEIFPRRVMQSVDYGIKNGGLECRVVEYESPDGKILGTILYLTAGARSIGCYAMRFNADEAIGTVQ